MSLSSAELYARILKNASKAEGLATIEEETQNLILECLSDLKILHSRIVELSIFSPNETLDDISTRDLVYLAVPYVFAEEQGRVRTTNRLARLASLIEIEKYLKSFIGVVEKYEVVPEDERKLYSRKVTDVVNFTKKRELKISQYAKEKDLEARIQKLQKGLGKKPALDDFTTDFSLILSLLPASSTQVAEGEGELDSETDEILRETTLVLLRLLYARAASQLSSLEQELQLLKDAPPIPENEPVEEVENPRDKKRDEENETWKLDLPFGRGPDGKGPLLDESGRPLRHFTILPSDAGERARLQGKVFGPGYNLPTMTIDEYLEIEAQRGTILTGGGPASQNAPTSSEQLTIDSEMDGTVQGELKVDEKRQKDEKWARYTDENPRGAGNKMNRG